VVKSLSESQPDFGFAGEPVDDQRYVEGSVRARRGPWCVSGGLIPAEHEI
jgi:hypothetical protein